MKGITNFRPALKVIFSQLKQTPLIRALQQTAAYVVPGVAIQALHAPIYSWLFLRGVTEAKD